MDFDQLNSFLEVARLGSFSRAAERLYKTQPAISAQVHQLELEFGKKLFNRSARRISLTVPGEVLFKCGEQLIAQHRETVQKVREAEGQAGGRLLIGMSESAATHLLPRILQAYLSAHPAVSVTVSSLPDNSATQAVAETALDLAIVELPVKKSNLRISNLLDSELCVLIPVQHRFAARKSLTIREILSERLVLSSSGFVRELINKMLVKVRPGQISILEIESEEAIRTMVQQGLGISIQLRLYAQSAIAGAKLRLIPIRGIDAARSIGIITRANRQLTLAAIEFEKIARQVVSRE